MENYQDETPDFEICAECISLHDCDAACECKIKQYFANTKSELDELISSEQYFVQGDE